MNLFSRIVKMKLKDSTPDQGIKGRRISELRA